MYHVPVQSGNMFQLAPKQLELQQRAGELALEVCAPGAAETDRSEQYPFDYVKAVTERLQPQLTAKELNHSRAGFILLFSQDAMK